MAADEADAAEKRKRGKINPDKGFSSFEDATARKYNSLVKQVRDGSPQLFSTILFLRKRGKNVAMLEKKAILMHHLRSYN